MPELSTEFWIASVLAVVALILGLGVTLAMDAKTKGEFRFAVVCFVISAGLVVCGIVEWQMATSWSALPRILVAYALLATTLVLAGETIRWARSRHERASVEPKQRTLPTKESPKVSEHPKPSETPTPTKPHPKPSITFTTYLQPNEPYPDGTLLAGIVWQKQFIDVRLDIANGAVAAQNLDFLVALDTSIGGIGQISQFPGVTAFPASSLPPAWLQGTDANGNPVSVPIAPSPGMASMAPIYRVQCSNIFADTVLHFVVASIALNPPENGHLPQQLFAPKTRPKVINIKGKYETRNGGSFESRNIEFSYKFAQQ